MASTITDLAINQSVGISNQAKALLVKVNDASATLTDVGASLLSLDEKAILRAIVNGVATRVGINSREVSLPFKAIALQIANV
jgi:hypothetical protein